MRADGLPAASTVASAMALASFGSLFDASSSQVLNSAKGWFQAMSLTANPSRQSRHHSGIGGILHRRGSRWRRGRPIMALARQRAAPALRRRMVIEVRRMRMIAAIALPAALLLAGCVDAEGGPNATGGALLGAAAGGLLGSQFGSGAGKLAATGAGAVLGGAIGGSSGQSLDRANRLAQNTAPPPSGTAPLPWQIPGASGTVTQPPPPPPGAPIGPGGHAECREFQQTILIGGQMQKAYGTACRQADGTWRIVP